MPAKLLAGRVAVAASVRHHHDGCNRRGPCAPRIKGLLDVGRTGRAGHEIDRAGHLPLAVEVSYPAEAPSRSSGDIMLRHHHDVIVGEEVERRRIVLPDSSARVPLSAMPPNARESPLTSPPAEAPTETSSVVCMPRHRGKSRIGSHAERGGQIAVAQETRHLGRHVRGSRRRGPRSRPRPPPFRRRGRRAPAASICPLAGITPGRAASSLARTASRRGASRPVTPSDRRSVASMLSRASVLMRPHLPSSRERVAGGSSVRAARARRDCHWLWNVPPCGAGRSR